jgi:hypothetical protein
MSEELIPHSWIDSDRDRGRLLRQSFSRAYEAQGLDSAARFEPTASASMQGVCEFYMRAGRKQKSFTARLAATESRTLGE